MKWSLDMYLLNTRERLDEVGAKDFYKDDELTRYLNQAINNMTKELRLEEVISIPLNGELELAFEDLFVSPSDLLLPIEERTHNFFQLKAVFINGTFIPMGTVKNKGDYRQVCYLWKNKVCFTQSQVGNLELFYLRKPSNLVNLVDTCDVPELYQHVPVSFVLARALEKDGEIGQADYYKGQYEQFKYEMGEEIEQNEMTEEIASVSDNYFSEGDYYGEF